MNKKHNPPIVGKKDVATLGRDSEIRVRYVPEEIHNELKAIGAYLRLRTVPECMLAVIRAFLPDQQSIKQLQDRNAELHRAMNRYQEREARQLAVMENWSGNIAKTYKEVSRYTATAIKEFKVGQKASRKKAAAVGSANQVKKSAPPKKVKRSLKQGRLL